MMKRLIKLSLKYVLFYSPTFFRTYLLNVKKRKELKMALMRKRRTKIKKEELERLIQSLDLDCDVFLHTSMMNIGAIEGGAKFVVETILNNFDIEHHTLLVSALPYRGSFYEYLKTNPTFDVRNAEVAMGVINERLAMRKDACRSIHPTHSVVAIGSQAQEYTATHHLDQTPFGEHSPYLKIFKNKGKILLLGATLDNVTAIHALEDLLGDNYPVDIYDKKDFKIRCYNEKGVGLFVSTKCHHPIKCLSRDVSSMRKYLEKVDAIKVTPVGESEIMLIDSLKFAACYFDMLACGRSIYGSHKVSKDLKEAISRVRQILNI